MRITKLIKYIKIIKLISVPIDPYSLLYELKFSMYRPNANVVSRLSNVPKELPAEKNRHLLPRLDPK